MTSQTRKNSLSASDVMRRTISLTLASTVAACGLLWLPLAEAAVAGKVTHLSGTLTTKRADGTVKLLSVKSEISEGDVLTTEEETYARVKFNDGGEVVLRPGTQLKIESYSFNADKPADDSVVMNMFKGGLRAVTGLLGKRSKEKVSFQTETATIGIRGTHFGALLCQNDCGGVGTTTGQPPPNGLHVDVTTGAVTMTNQGGTVQLNAGQFGFAATANTPPAQVPPQQSAPVTMPSSIASNKGGGKGIGKGDDANCKVQ